MVTVIVTVAVAVGGVLFCVVGCRPASRGGVFPVCKCAAGRCEGRPVCLARWPHDEVCESLHDVCVMLTDDSVCCSVVFVAGSTAFANT